MVLALLLLLALVVGLVVYVQRNRTYWSRRDVDGPSPLPLFGNMWNYLLKKQHYGEVYHDIYDKYTNVPYVGVYKVLNQPAILLKDLELIKDVLTVNFESFHDNDFVVNETLDPLISQNPFAAAGANWKVARTNMAPLFTLSKIKSLFPIIDDICQRFLIYIANNRTDVNAVQMCSKYTLEVMASCGMGVEAQTFTNDQSPFITMTEQIYTHGSLLKTTAVLFLPALGRVLQMPYISETVDRWMRSMVDDIMQIRQSTKERRVDLLQNLLDAREKRGDISDNQITGYCLSMLLEGFETSSGLMSYTLFELASHPDVQRQVQEEVDRVLLKSNGRFTDDAVQDMQFLESICYEVSRLYAPMLVLTKRCTQRFELPPQNPNKSDKNVVVEPGTVMVIPVYSIHRDPLYYDNPTEFDPHRFYGDNKNKHNKFAYLSFGEGQRLCIGMKFAFAQSKAAVAAILSKYTVEFSSKQTLPLTTAKTTFLLSCENGIWLNFVERNK